MTHSPRLLAAAVALALSPVAAHSQVLLTQPTNLTSISPIFFNPKVNNKNLPSSVFGLVIWQPNPDQLSGLTVPVKSWDAGVKTGLHPTNLALEQTGYADAPNSTVGQVSGGTVGAYLNSNDLQTHGACNKMMITPGIKWTGNSVKYPFVSLTGAVDVSFDLQVPTAVGSSSPNNNAYVAGDIELLDPIRNVKISNGVNVFYINSQGSGAQSVGYDAYSHAYMLNTALVPNSTWVHALPGNAARQSKAWSGFLTYKYEVTHNSIQGALNALHAAYPTLAMSTNPKDYGLIGFHLNAELHCISGHAELGWSMRNLKISLAKAQ